MQQVKDTGEEQYLEVLAHQVQVAKEEKHIVESVVLVQSQELQAMELVVVVQVQVLQVMDIVVVVVRAQ
jgi:hypothetical protein